MTLTLVELGKVTGTATIHSTMQCGSDPGVSRPSGPCRLVIRQTAPPSLAGYFSMAYQQLQQGRRISLCHSHLAYATRGRGSAVSDRHGHAQKPRMLGPLSRSRWVLRFPRHPSRRRCHLESRSGLAGHRGTQTGARVVQGQFMVKATAPAVGGGFSAEVEFTWLDASALNPYVNLWPLSMDQLTKGNPRTERRHARAAGPLASSDTCHKPKQSSRSIPVPFELFLTNRLSRCRSLLDRSALFHRGLPTAHWSGLAVLVRNGQKRQPQAQFLPGKGKHRETQSPYRIRKRPCATTRLARLLGKALIWIGFLLLPIHLHGAGLTHPAPHPAAEATRRQGNSRPPARRIRAADNAQRTALSEHRDIFIHRNRQLRQWPGGRDDRHPPPSSSEPSHPYGRWHTILPVPRIPGSLRTRATTKREIQTCAVRFSVEPARHRHRRDRERARMANRCRRSGNSSPLWGDAKPMSAWALTAAERQVLIDKRNADVAEAKRKVDQRLKSGLALNAPLKGALSPIVRPPPPAAVPPQTPIPIKLAPPNGWRDL